MYGDYKFSLCVKYLMFQIYISEVISQHYHSIAVMEYQAINDTKLKPQERLMANTEKYLEIIQNLSLSENNVFLVLFPEGTLEARNGEKPKLFATEVKVKDIPCLKYLKKYAEFFRKLSCAAYVSDITIVLNLIREEESKFYSTDTVLGTLGQIQYSNKKEDRIGESDLHHSPIPFEIPSNKGFIVTDVYNLTQHMHFNFSPTSLLTGFKFSYEKMISSKGYRNYLICSNWISQLPFLTSLQVHQMWAQEFNITLFFSGANNPKYGQGGTGIYHGNKKQLMRAKFESNVLLATGGPLLMDFSVNEGTKIYLYNFITDDLPGTVLPFSKEKDVDTLAKEMDDFYLQKDPDLIKYKSKILNMSIPESNVTLCYDKKKDHFCCNFYLKISTNNTLKSQKHYTYHLVAYKGIKSYYSIFEPGGVEICAIIACLNEKLSSCGQRFKKYEEISWPVNFQQLIIKANFAVPRKEKIYYSSQFPNSLLSSIRPIHPNFTKWSKQVVYDKTTKKHMLERTFSLTKPQTRILTFAIFGRNFSLKGKSKITAPRVRSGTAFYLISNSFVVILLCLCTKIP